MMLAHHGALDKLKLFHLEDGGFNHQRDYKVDYSSEDSIAATAEIAAKERPLDLVIAANGILHDKDLIPEKSLRDLSARKLHRIVRRAW